MEDIEEVGEDDKMGVREQLKLHKVQVEVVEVVEVELVYREYC